MLITNWFSTSQLIRLTGQKILLPFYHTVADKPLPHISSLYALRNLSLFEQDLDFFCRYYEPISVTSLYEIINNNILPEKPVFHLTFDDGLSEIYTTIAPVLEKRNIPATFFVNTDFIDNRNLFYRYKVSLIIEKILQDKQQHSIAQTLLNVSQPNDVFSALLQLKFQDLALIDTIAEAIAVDFTDYLTQNQPYLTSPQIYDLIKRGFVIGSHSASHPLFKNITLAAQKQQLIYSFQYLEKQFGITEKYFAFPFTDDGVSAEFITWLHEGQNCKLSFGTAGLKHDFTKNHIQRIGIEGSLNSAETIVNSEYLYYALKSVFRKNVISR